jgi:hypothetical protein
MAISTANINNKSHLLLFYDPEPVEDILLKTKIRKMEGELLDEFDAAFATCHAAGTDFSTNFQFKQQFVEVFEA